MLSMAHTHAHFIIWFTVFFCVFVLCEFTWIGARIQRAQSHHCSTPPAPVVAIVDVTHTHTQPTTMLQKFSFLPKDTKLSSSSSSSATCLIEPNRAGLRRLNIITKVCPLQQQTGWHSKQNIIFKTFDLNILTKILDKFEKLRKFPAIFQPCKEWILQKCIFFLIF